MLLCSICHIMSWCLLLLGSICYIISPVFCCWVVYLVLISFVMPSAAQGPIPIESTAMVVTGSVSVGSSWYTDDSVCHLIWTVYLCYFLTSYLLLRSFVKWAGRVLRLISGRCFDINWEALPESSTGALFPLYCETFHVSLFERELPESCL